MLHPDGKNHLSDDQRQIKLSDLDYFKQRLFNVNPQWRNNTHWVFAATVYREKKDLQRNIDIGYSRGKKNVSDDGGVKYSLSDPYSVFQNVANTPAYHKKGRMEMMARLDNFGPFHVFFTLSCADYRWPENLVAILHEHGIGLRCSIHSNHTESYEVLSDSSGWITMEEYMKNEMDESLHEIMRKNVVTATRNYQQRVAALMQTIVRNRSNPLSVKHFSSKLEFQGRGAGHHHSTLWLDIEKIEQKVDLCQLNEMKHSISFTICNCNKYLESHLRDTAEYMESLDEFLKTRGIDPGNVKEKNRKHRTFKYLEKLMTKKKETELNQKEEHLLKDLRHIYPFYGLATSLRKMHNGEEITEEDIEVVVAFVDTFSTVSLHPALVGPIVAAIAYSVNQHHHTKTCRKYQTKCRFKFPKLPSYRTLIARPPGKDTSNEEKKILEAQHEKVLKKVKEVLEDKEIVDSIISQYPKESEKTADEAIQGRNKRIDAILERAGLNSTEGRSSYEAALSYNSSGYSVVLARDIDELNVNSYNPEITQAWNGNTDFQFCFDLYAIITYITEYFVKDDSGVVKNLVNTMNANEDTDLKDKMKLLMNTWIKNRQMGEAEAVYRLTKEFHFKESDSKCVFVQTCPRSERSKFLKNVTDKPEFKNVPKVTIQNKKDTEYVEQYDVNSKYERRPILYYPTLKYLSFSQMVKMYEPFWGKKDQALDIESSDEENEPDMKGKDKNIQQEEAEENMLSGCIPSNINNKESQENIVSGHVPSIINNEESEEKLLSGYMPNYNIEETRQNMFSCQLPSQSINISIDGDSDIENSDEKFNYVMACTCDWENSQKLKLPKVFRLTTPYLGEPPFMRLRRHPAVLRFHKYKEEKDPDAYWFSEALLYFPHKNEEDLTSAINDAKTGGADVWKTFVHKIAHVKSQVMEFLQDNEEARMMAAEMIIDNALTGEFIDPEGEQDNEDNRLDEHVQCEEFNHLDPEYIEAPIEEVFEMSFRPIEVPLQNLCKDAQKLDYYQRKVLEIGVKHARALVKARGGKNHIPTAPLYMIDGAAGAGKSCTINILKEFIQLIMQQPGDNPECPHILLCAPTGTAAVNIQGQTLHSTFGLDFGNDHYTLPDKTRDKKRALFKNLRFLIVDEISMMKADQLYQLDLRLREITMCPDKIFGDVALFFFADIMQLKPVRGQYIWCQPASVKYLQAFMVQSHWECFNVISLVENHRQHGNEEYANILNHI